MNNLLERGTFVLSLDTELGWGLAHYGKQKIAKREAQCQQARPCISRLLKLLEKYEVHATWAVVGHLFLEECHPLNGVKHPEIIRPTYTWFPGDWFDPDPCTRLEDASSWYGRDIIQQILSCKVSQEIGCHTFSHIRVGDPGCSHDCFASELQACRLAAKEYGVALESFVFPNNMEGHLDVLSEQGFLTYRGNHSPQLGRLPQIVRGLIKYSKMWPTALPEERMGLWNLPGCMFYPPPKGITMPAAVAFQVFKAKRALHRAAQKRQLFHLWFHPFNLTANPERLLRGLENIFIEFSRYRDKGLLDNFTMGELARALQLQKNRR